MLTRACAGGGGNMNIALVQSGQEQHEMLV